MSRNGTRDRRSGGRGTVEGRQRPRWRTLPTLMALEDRWLMSTFTVTNTADSGTGSLRYEIGLANSNAGANTIDFDCTVFNIAADNHPDRQPARAEQYERDGDDHGSGGWRDGQRRWAKPGVPGRRECHGVNLGTDDHRGQRERRRRWPGQRRRHDHADQLHRQRQLRHQRRRPVHELRRHDHADQLHVSGNSADQRRRPVYNEQWHDHPDQLQRQRQLRLLQRRRTVQLLRTTTLTNCTVSGNSAGNFGGGLYDLIGTTTLTNSTFIGNSAYVNGGGMFDNLGTSTLNYCTLTGNSASVNGGGLFNNLGTSTLNYCTLSGSSAAVNGGGLYNDGGTTALTNCTVSGNFTGNNGGGLYTLNGTTTLTNVSLRGNSAGLGGGLANSGGTTTLTNVSVSGNSAENGGGLYNLNGTTDLTNVFVSGNSASSGGGLSTYDGTTKLTDCTVSGNSASSGGGGVFNDLGTTTLLNCTVNGNYATAGGGVANYNYGTTTLTNCTVSGNSAAGDGGGVVTAHSTTTLTNSTVSGNSASGDGGGLYTTSGGATTLTNVTIIGNTAGVSGGGLDNGDGKVTIGNTIVAGNAASNGGPEAFGTFTSLGNNLIGETDGSYGWVGSDLTGTTDQPLNPLLAPLSNYGGPTQTMALLPGSPAIDAGNNALIADGVTTDQRGFPRIVNGVVDIGAFESSGFTIAVNSGSGQSTAVFTAFSGPLVATVTANNPIEPVAGGLVTFTPPQSGPSATLNGTPATISATGTATVTATANGVGGIYTVLAGARGAPTPAIFSLANKWIPTFSDLSRTIVYGTPETTLTGHLGAGTAYPTGSIVSIMLNSVTQTDTVDSSGNFSTTFSTATLGVAGGPYTVTYAFAGNPTFTAASDTSTTVTVTPASLTITANGVSRVYGASDSTLGVIYSGFVNGETSSVLGGTLSVVDSDAATTTGVGSYAGVITASGQTSTNYTITYAAGNLIVTPAALTITAGGVSRVYGASDPTLGVIYSGFVNGETSGVLGGTLSVVDSDAATTTGVGGYAGVITASGQTSTNYTITYAAANLIVTPAALTITAGGVSRVYGASDPTLGVIYSGFVNGEASSVLGGTLSVVDSDAATTTGVGSYAGVITASGQTSTNYAITYAAANLIVTPAALTITANGVSRVYGASDPTLGVGYSGFVNGETSSVLGGTLSVVDSQSATTTAVGGYTGVIMASGQTSTNYTITYAAGNLTITPASLTITAAGVSRVYGASDPTLGVTYSGFVNGEMSSVLGGTLSVVDSKGATTTAAGSYTGVITSSGQSSTNYTIVYAAGNLRVTPAALTVTANGVSRIYGASDPTLGVGYSGFVNGETSNVLGGTLTVVDSKAATTTGVGSYTNVITASGQTSTNYTITYTTGNLTVTPAALTITANGVSRVYGASDPTLGVGYSAFVNGETSSVLGGTLSVVDSKALTTTAVGSYTGVIMASGQTSTNYTITYATGNLTVTPASLTITATGVSRVYGASDPTLGVTYSGFVNGETSSVLGGTLSVVDSNGATTTAAGSYTGVITSSGQSSTNYTIAYAAGNLRVTPASLTITANGVSRVYGASDPTLGATYLGFVNGETSSVLGGTLSVVDSKAITTTAVGSYTSVITISGQTSTNYTITYVAGNLTVTPASLTITANGVSRVYGASDPTLGATYTGFVNGETSSVLGGTLSVLDSKSATTTSVGSYTSVVTASGQTSTNYTITYSAGNLTVTPASLTITANGVSRVYGASDPTPSVGYSGFVNGEAASVLGGTLSVVDSKATTTTAVGSYTSVITASGQTSTNYTITYVAGNLTVTPASLTITANGVSRVYGASDPTLGATYAGFVNGETSSVLGGTLSVPDSKSATTTSVGSYTSVITASGQTSTNYTITYVAGNLTVTPASLTITANGVSRVYGASDPTLSVGYSGFVNGEAASVLGGTLSVVDSKMATTTSVGSYASVITASGQTSTNYTITYVAGNLTVTPASLTITANGVSRVYGASDPTLGVGYSGFVNGETSSVLGGTLSVVDSKTITTTTVGSYNSVIMASGQTSTNYTITYVAGNLTVTPASLTITANGVSRVYGASDPALGATYAGFVNGETSSVLGGTLSVVDSKAATTTGVGSYANVITASGQTSTNYTITYSAGNLTVTPASLTITSNGVSRVYGASDPTLGVGYSGFVNGETSSVLGGTLSVVDSKAATTTAVGSYTSVITASGQTSTNYTITYSAGNLTVTPAALTITANGVSRVYGTPDPTLGVTYSGFVNGETSSVLGGALSVLDSKAAPTTSVGSYASVITASGRTAANYTITYSAGNLTITPATLTITANSTSKTYGQTVTFAGTEFTTSGLVNSDSVVSVSLSSTGAAATATVVGSPYAIIASNAGGSGLGNYTIGYVNGSLTVIKASPTISTTPSNTAVTLGTSSVNVKDTAVLSGGYNETGSITFTLYLGNTLEDTETVSVAANGSYTTPTGYTLPTTGTVTGTYQWDSAYSGDTNNNTGSDMNNGQEQVKVSPAITSITTVPGGTIGVGSFVVSGTKYLDLTGNGVSAADTPQGGVTIDLYEESNSTAGLQAGSCGDTFVASTTTATNGTYSFSVMSAGTYYVQESVPAGYVQTGGGPNGSAGNSYYTIVGTSGHTYSGNNFDDYLVPTCAPTNVSFTVTTPSNCSTTVTNLAGNTQPGDTVTATFTVPSGTNDQLTLLSYTAPGPTFSAATAYQQVIYQQATGTFAPGAHSITVQIPNSDYQIDFVCGQTISQLEPNQNGNAYGPDSATILYHAQNRFISGDNGGTTTPTPTPTPTPTQTPTPTPTVTPGQTLTDSATLSGGFNPTGTITFYLFAPGVTPNGTDSNNVYSDTVTVSGNGSYATSTGTNPGGYMPTLTGTYQWVAVYSADGNNSAATGSFGSEPEAVGLPTPSITTTPSPTIVPLGTAASLTDTATLAGGANPTGTITFTLYQGSTKLETETVTVRGDGSYTTPTSYSLSSSVSSGVYQWNASYSGDTNNNASNDNNDPAEQVTVVTPCCTLQNIGYSVYNPANMTTTTPADLSGNTQEGDIITVTFTVPAGNYEQNSLVSYNAPEGFYNANDANLQTVFQSVTQVEGPGTHTLSITLPPNFYQVDFVCGAVIPTLGPTATNPNNFYHAQNRYIDGDNGGVNPAGSGVLSVTGEVYNDVNLNGKLDSNDQALANATVTLTGTDFYSNAISETATTNGSGVYSFSGLPFSNSTGYAVSVSSPSGYSSATAAVGTVSGAADGIATTSPEGVQGIVLGSSTQSTGTGYNLGLVTSSDFVGGNYSIVILSPTANGALTVSGNAKVNVPGAIVVDSSSSTAISGSGTASVTASIIDTVGGYQKASGEAFGPAPSTGVASLADPLAGLATPSTSGLTNYGSVNLTTGSQTIKPGIYSSIKVSNSASLTMNAGMYIIEGGGFSVSGSANVSGSGVTIYNTGSNCPSTGGTYGNINWSSTGTFSLSAPSSGTYAGIVIFQSRDNTQTLSLNVSGKSGSAITGTIYAASAQLVDGGTTALTGSLIVNLLTVSTGATANSLGTPAGGVAYSPAQVLSAYGINNLALDGSGQTIAIVDSLRRSRTSFRRSTPSTPSSA